MLSILIPVYNYDVSELVTELHSQAISLNIPFEIICLNDSSSSKNPFTELSHFLWLENSENIGRAKTRNKLVSAAKHKTLLFLDADMRVFHASFLSDYISSIEKAPVICGGIEYSLEKPSKENHLRWNYGRKKEVRSSEARNKAPYESFMTGVFLIEKDVLVKIPFDESLTSYGHEDTLLGKSLVENSITVFHTDNPAIHEGLESNEEFILKTKEGLKTLSQLYSQKKMSRNYSGVVSLYERLKSLGLLKIFLLAVYLLEKMFYSRMVLNGSHIWLFQLLKLKWFTESRKAI